MPGATESSDNACPASVSAGIPAAAGRHHSSGMSRHVPFLDAAYVRKVLQPTRLLESLSAALQSFSRRDGSVVQPVRVTIPVERYGGFMGVMPALTYERGGALGVKVVTWNPSNPPPMPTHFATVLLFDPRTGAPTAILDGEVITATRTAAVSALAVDALTPRALRILAVLGAGVQARTHIEYMCLVRRFDEVRVWSRSADSVAACVRDVTDRVGTARVLAMADAQSAVQNADVVVTATSSRTPVLQGAWLRLGAMVVSVGAPRPDQRELDDAVMRQAMVVVDSVEGARAEAGDVILSGAPIHAELGQILAHAAPSRPPGLPFTVFKSLGMAVEDVAAAQCVMEAMDSVRVAPQPSA